MEVLVHFPDGGVESTLSTLKCEDYARETYYVEAPFFTEEHKKGISYAELICLGYPIAGLVISTDSDETPTAWTGKELARIIGKVSAMTVLQYINYINGKPVGRIKYALN